MNLHPEHLLSPVPAALIVLLAAACATLARRLRAERRRVAELTLVDTLTGLGNRRLLELEVPREAARARRAQRWLFVAVADVDRLEPYNHSAGRPAGHAVLAAIGSVLRSSLRRAGDHAFRSHGDRFLFAFSSEHPHDGAAMAERIRGRVAELATFHPENPPFGFVTITLGLVAVPPGDLASLVLLEERCAEALAIARKEGRNRTVGLDLAGERIRTSDGVPLAGRASGSG